MISSSSRAEAHPGCPTLSWMIASRVCDRHADQDAFISFVGRKGAGKSTASIAFCEALAEDIARLRGKGEPPSKFFSIDNIKSISETGAFDLLSSGALKQENSVFLLDDTGTQWSARNFQSFVNKGLNSILQICRVYKCVLVCNFIASNHIDVQARGMTDYRAEMLYKNTRTGQAFFKFFYIENSSSGEYRKYLTWHGKRITTWIIEKPSKELYEAYVLMRRENTDQFIEDTAAKMESKRNPEKHEDRRIKDYASMPLVRDNLAEVHTLKKDGLNVEQIVRKTGLTRYWVQRCLSLHPDLPR